jgi:aspartokinase
MESDMTTNNLKDKLADTAGKAKETAAAALDVAAEAGRTVTSEVKARAADTVDTVRGAAGERAEAARDTLVTAGERLAETLQSEAAGKDGVSARVMTGLAGGVTTVTEGLRGKSFGDLVTDAKDYARRHPGTFAVGAAVAGFALARFLRSTGARQAAATRAEEDRLYRDAARRTVDTLGGHRDRGSQA